MRSSRHRSVPTAVVVFTTVMALAGCGAAKDKVVNDALEDSGIELNDLGRSLPDSYPDEVPVPTEGSNSRVRSTPEVTPS